MADILDSGERRQFETGAVRDIQEGKGRCDLLPLDAVGYLFDTFKQSDTVGPGAVFNALNGYMFTHDPAALIDVLLVFVTIAEYNDISSMILDVSVHYEEGAKKYGERNWEKGIPMHCFIDSAVRHLLKYLREDTDEDHKRAFVWNILGALWTHKNRPNLIDIPLYHVDKPGVEEGETPDESETPSENPFASVSDDIANSSNEGEVDIKSDYSF